MTPNPKAKALRRTWLAIVVMSAATTVLYATRGEWVAAVASTLALALWLFVCDVCIDEGVWTDPRAETSRLLAEIDDRESERADLRDRVTKAEAALARVEALAKEHAECSGCRTPWWLSAALKGES